MERSFRNTVAFALCAMFFMVFVLFVVTAINDFELYKAESECVTEYVNNGVERNRIQTSNGECSLID